MVADNRQETPAKMAVNKLRKGMIVMKKVWYLRILFVHHGMMMILFDANLQTLSDCHVDLFTEKGEKPDIRRILY